MYRLGNVCMAVLCTHNLASVTILWDVSSAEVPEQGGRNVLVHLLSGGGLPARHHRLPTQRLQGRICCSLTCIRLSWDLLPTVKCIPEVEVYSMSNMMINKL